MEERIKALEALLAEKERLIKVYEKIMDKWLAFRDSHHYNHNYAKHKIQQRQKCHHREACSIGGHASGD